MCLIEIAGFRCEAGPIGADAFSRDAVQDRLQPDHASEEFHSDTHVPLEESLQVLARETKLSARREAERAPRLASSWRTAS